MDQFDDRRWPVSKQCLEADLWESGELPFLSDGESTAAGTSKEPEGPGLWGAGALPFLIAHV